jgi:hypothetical protein
MYSTGYSGHILIKREFFQQNFGKPSSIKLLKNQYSGSRVVPCGQTDRQADVQTDRQTYRQTDRQMDRQTGRQTDRQTDRQAERQT